MPTKRIENKTGLGLLFHREGIRRGFTLEQQAAALGYHRTALARWSSGERTPGDTEWATLAAWFGLDPLWLYKVHKDGTLHAEAQRLLDEGR